MAVSMAATLTLSTGNAVIVAGQRFTASLKLTESGGTNTNFVSAQPFCTNGFGQPVAAKFGTLANSFTIGNYTGAAQVITANTSTFINFECVIDAPLMPNMGSDVAPAYFLMGCTCQTSDGSVFSAPTVGFSVNTSTNPAPNGQVQIIGSTTNAYANVYAPGYLRFDQPNTAFIPLCIP